MASIYKFSLIKFLVILEVFIQGSICEYQNYREIWEDERNLQILDFISPQNLLGFDFGLQNVTEDSLKNLNFSTCHKALLVYQQALVRRELWALKMLDSSSKIPSGLLMGNIIDIGQYDECLAVNGTSLGMHIKGRPCSYSIRIVGNDSIPFNPNLAICIPSSCGPKDIASFLNKSLHVVEAFIRLGIEIDSAQCSPMNRVYWTSDVISVYVILSIFLAFLITCTVIEYCERHRAPGEPTKALQKTLSNFSLYSNAVSILSTDVKSGNIPVIHGLRVLSIVWVVLGHEYVTQLIGVNVNNLDVPDWINSWNSLYIFTAPFAVDTFFTVSGFLMAYLGLKEMSKRNTFNLPVYYLHRYIRLTPPVIMLLVGSIYLIPKLGSGARWEFITGLFISGCRTKWWSFLVYGQNFVEKDNLCLGHLWYLAVDMQLFLISPIILYPLWKKPKLGFGILGVFFIAALATPASIIGYNKYPALSFVHNINAAQGLKIFQDVYIMPYNRAGPWLIGILTGYDLAKNERSLKLIHIYLGWALAIFCFIFCIMGTRSFIEPDYVYKEFWETFFSTVSRPLWGMGICWIIYASIYKCGGPITWILSWKAFLPFSRISYNIYLLHIAIQITKIGAIRVPHYFSDFAVINSFLSNLSFTIIAAFFFTLLFESPIISLEKIIFKRERRSIRFESQKDLRKNIVEEDIEDENEDQRA